MENVILDSIDRSDFNPNWTDSWHYSPGASPSGELWDLRKNNPALFDALRRAEPETLEHTGNVLSRYVDMLNRAGFAY